MTAEQLYGLLQFIDSLDNRLNLQGLLQSVRDTLNQLVGSPAQPHLQNNLATALNSFTTATAQMARAVSPSHLAAIQEMGGGEFFAFDIASKINESIQTHAMTPAVARDFVTDLTARRAEFLATIRNVYQSLQKLGIKEATLAPGAADVAFHIPREIFDNELGAFAKELTFLSRLIQDITEAQTGQPEPVVLESLSSSVPKVALFAALPVLQVLGTVINKYLEAWQRVEEIRITREKLLQMRVGKTALQELTHEIKTTVDEVIEESTEIITVGYKGNRGELGNAIRSDMRRLFGQIERGLTVEFAANPEGADEANKENLQQIASQNQGLKFPEIAREPLLLKSGEILEDDSEGVQTARRSTKTTTTRTTTTTKEPAEKDSKSV